jgi:hypothetical protein
MTLTDPTARGAASSRASVRRRTFCLFTGLFTCVISAGVGAFATGASAAPADSAAPPGWQATQAPLPSGAAASPAVTVRQVTCAAPGECVGVASYNNASGVGTGVIEQLHHGTWQATLAPVPAGVSASEKVTLTSVSCPTRFSCGVSGYYENPTVTRRSELLTLSDGQWTGQAAPLLPGTLPDSQTLSAISCPRPGACVAVGRYQGGPHGYYEGLIEVQAGGSWHAVEAPMPGDQTRTADPFGGVDWVSCRAPGLCMTVGAYVDNQGRRELFADALYSDKWHSVRLPLPAKADANPLAYLGYVTCVDPADCLAVGNLDVTGGAQQGLFEREVAGKWKATVAPLPKGAAASPDATLDEASCPTRFFCAATGNYDISDGDGRGVLETLTDGKWHAAPAAAPTGDNTNRYMQSVSCPIAGRCVAAGSTNFSGLLEGYADGKWTLTTAPLPAQGTGAIFAGTSVSCPSRWMCAAFGSFELHGPPQSQQGLLETYSG